MTNEPEKAEPLIYTLTMLSCIGGFLFGYDTGVISGALVQISDKFDLTDWEKELVVSITVAGALVAAVVSGPASDYYGRRPVVLVSSVVFTVGAILMAIAESYDVLIVGRFIVGLGVGAASTSMPVFVSEAAPSEKRGVLVTCVNLAVTGGQFIAACISGAFISVDSGWRYMVGIAAIPAIIQFIGFLFLPESPRWLLEHDMVDQAVMALRKLRGVDDVRAEVQDILETIRDERASQTTRQSATSNVKYGSVPVEDSSTNDNTNILPNESVSLSTQDRFTNASTAVNACVSSICATVNSLFAEVTIRRALLVGCALQAAQQIAGINTVMYYTATILKLAGFTTNSEAVWLSAAVAFCNFFGTIVGLIFVDAVGRRKLTLFSLAAVCLVLIGIAIAFYEAEYTSQEISYTDANGSSNGHCNSYKYCFDCVQDEDCGYCSNYNDVAAGVSNAYACVLGDDSNPTNTATCASSDYYGETCPGSSSTTVGWMIFMLLCLYLLAFAPGMGSMPWCINSEIYPTSVRGIANSIATTVNWGTNFAMSASFLTLMNAATRQGAFLIYAVISIAFLLFFYKYLPETKERELEDIQMLFNSKHWGRAYKKSKPRSGSRRSHHSVRSKGKGFTGDDINNPILDYDAPVLNSNTMSIGAVDADVDRYDNISIMSANQLSNDSSILSTESENSAYQQSLKGMPGLDRNSLVSV